MTVTTDEYTGKSREDLEAYVHLSDGKLRVDLFQASSDGGRVRVGGYGIPLPGEPSSATAG